MTPQRLMFESLSQTTEFSHRSSFSRLTPGAGVIPGILCGPAIMTTSYVLARNDDD
jgi:hypothetical protein